MRRWVPLVAGALVAALTGCSDLPAGVDGDLTDGWPAPPAATPFRPAPGCQRDPAATGSIDEYAPVPCTEPHLAETAVVADLPVLDPARVHRECSRRVAAFLGGDWRTGRLALVPVLPSRDARLGGARWYRCDLAEISPVRGEPVRRSASLRGALAGAGPLRLTCADPDLDGERITGMHPVPCAGRHTAEFAGIFEIDGGPSSVAGLTADDVGPGCQAAIARFAGIPDDDTIASRAGWLSIPPDPGSWKLGERGVRCFLWLDGEQMTGSYRNAGTRKLKIQYAD
ncbi:septum formation family protein [Actinoplanes sp. URMC 104]|uniref:septum formation family protein n=1 Tax=Actinoplanes sp. URMC 104 TaxID=3423409 RepID=UPI003F19EBE6